MGGATKLKGRGEKLMGGAKKLKGRGEKSNGRGKKLTGGTKSRGKAVKTEREG